MQMNCCQCQEMMEETGRLDGGAASITTAGSHGGHTRALITCIHGDSWEAVLLPGDPLFCLVASLRLEMYTDAA